MLALPDLHTLHSSPFTRLNCNLAATAGPQNTLCWHDVEFRGFRNSHEGGRPIVHILTKVGNSKYVYADKVTYLSLRAEAR